MPSYTGRRPFSEAEIAQITASLEAGESASAIASRMGRSQQAIHYYAMKRPHKRLVLAHPSPSKWRAAALAAATEAGVPVEHVMGRKRTKRVSRARWAAWKALADEGRYAIIGIGRVGGYDHSSVCHALQRMAEIK